MARRKKLIRGVVLMTMFGLVAGALGSTPGMALDSQDKRQVKKISRKVANKVFDKRFDGGGGGGGGGNAGCPNGTDRYGEGCIEENTRAGAQWEAAAKTCGDLNRRLPTAGELMAYRNVTGVTLENEWSDDLTDIGSVARAYRVADNGNLTPQDISTSGVVYRCVAGLI